MDDRRNPFRDQPDGRPDERLLDVIQALADGLEYAEAASMLGLRWTTFKARAHRAYVKLGAKTAAEAVAIAFRKGWIK